MIKRKFTAIQLLLAITACFVAPTFAAKAGWKDNGKYSRVFLTSYPRSGNHWGRYVIEAITGIATGSVRLDRDPLHLSKPFEWGGYALQGGYEGTRRMPKAGDVVVLKSHYMEGERPIVYDAKPGAKVVRLVRFPFDCIRSHYLHFSEGGGTKNWHDFVREKAKKWKEFQEHWDAQPNVVTIRYEDLIGDPATGFQEICDTFGIVTTEGDLERAVRRYPPINSVGKHLQHYSDEDVADMVEIFQEQLYKYGYDKLLEER